MKKLTKDIIFNSEHLSCDLTRKSIRGGMTTMVAQGIRFILYLTGTMILARLLTPSDFGLIGMVSVVVIFAAMFKDAGLSMATVQKENISHEQISTLFWINVFISFFLGLCVLGVSPLVAWFYGKPELTAVTAALSISFIISGLTIQHQALLRRHMQFSILAIINIISYVFNLIVVISLALAGFRYWALVWGTLTTALSGALLTFFFCPWIPGRMKKGTGVRDMLTFGGHLIGFEFVNYFARNLDNILLGRFWGADVLGLYSKAYGIMMLPLNQIRGPLNAVAIPALSHIQNDLIRFKSYYLKLVGLLAFITMPLMVFLFICSVPVINILLGQQWSGSVKIFKILCIVSFIQPVSGTTGLVLLSLGQSKRYFTAGVISSVAIVISFVLGLPWGATGIAIAYTITNYLILIPMLWYCFRQSPISITDFFSAVLRPVVASICMGGAIFASHLLLTDIIDIITIGACLIIGMLVYFLVLLVVPGGLRLLQEHFSYCFLFFQKNT